MKHKPTPQPVSGSWPGRIHPAVWLLLGAAIATLVRCHSPAEYRPAEAGFPDPVIVAQQALGELSGLAVSTLDSNVLWALNDSGNGNQLFAIDKHNGADLGQVTLDGVVNVDWEDLASFSIDGRAWLLIADVGDNDAERQLVHLWVAREPQPDADGRYQGSIRPAADIAYTYPQGPRDVESVAVDTVGQRIMIISKRDPVPRVYSLPLHTSTPPDGVLQAEYIGEVNQLEQPSNLDRLRFGQRAEWISQPTALDLLNLSDGGQYALLLTYKQAYGFRKLPGQSWADTFAGQPVIVPMPPLPQAEALALDPDGRHYWLTSERLPTPLYRLQLPTSD